MWEKGAEEGLTYLLDHPSHEVRNHVDIKDGHVFATLFFRAWLILNETNTDPRRSALHKAVVQLCTHTELASASANCCPWHFASLAVNLNSGTIELLLFVSAVLGAFRSDTAALELLSQSLKHVGTATETTNR